MFRWLRVKWLIKKLGHRKRYVRFTAVEELGELGDARAVEALIRTLEDECDDVRSAAADALGKLGDARAVEPHWVMAKGVAEGRL